MFHTVNKKTNNIPSYQVEQFQALITKLYQCCQERTQYQSERFGLPDAELRCLMLFGDERYLTASGIAYKLNVVKSRVTRIISGLEQKGMIQRVKDPDDSRVTLLRLTLQGTRKLEEVKTFISELHYEILSQMPPSQRRALLDDLDLLKNSMEAVKELMT
jgi:DNA-binding MarR family transcriptional regulator